MPGNIADMYGPMEFYVELSGLKIIIAFHAVALLCYYPHHLVLSEEFSIIHEITN
jgi:hypothetical protein